MKRTKGFLLLVLMLLGLFCLSGPSWAKAVCPEGVLVPPLRACQAALTDCFIVLPALNCTIWRAGTGAWCGRGGGGCAGCGSMRGAR